jgi:hypothetical protein
VLTNHINISNKLNQFEKAKDSGLVKIQDDEYELKMLKKKKEENFYKEKKEIR